MFEWQKVQTEKLCVEREILKEELNNLLKEKNNLEELEEIKKYNELLNHDTVIKYISLLQHIEKKKESIQSRDFSVDKLKKDICLHSRLYFISDETSHHNCGDSKYKYYRCECCDCGLVKDFLFYDGMKNVPTFVELRIHEKRRVKKLN